MTLVRLITVKIAAEKAAEAIGNWRKECGPLMMRQPGCVSEQLLRGVGEPGLFVSYSEWASQADIDAYLRSEDHQQIKRHNLKLGPAEVKVETFERAL